jgi:hypothetical protein
MEPNYAAPNHPAPSYGAPPGYAAPPSQTPNYATPPGYGAPPTSAQPSQPSPGYGAQPTYGAPPTSAPPGHGLPPTSAPPNYAAPPNQGAASQRPANQAPANHEQASQTQTSQTQTSQTPANQAPAPLAAPPAKVLALAATRGLGPHHLTRKGENPIAMFFAWTIVGLILFGVAWLCGWLAGKTEIRALAIGALLGVLGGLFVIAYGFFEIFRGFRVTYLFHNGLVWTRNGRPDAATWADLDRLTETALANKRPHHAKVTTLDGRHVPIMMEWTDDADPVHARLVEVFHAMGRPVLDSEPPPRPGPETGLEDKTLIRIAAIFGVIGGLALSFVLYLAVGTSIGLGLAIGFLVIALTICAAGFVIDQRLIRAGQVFLGLFGVIMLINANHLFEGHYIIVTGATLAVEAAVVAAGIGIFRRLPAPRRFGPRRKLAQKSGWRFMAEAAVPVGGPKTATRLIGVPTQANSTTGEGTVTAAANGMTCVAYDRARRRPRLTDPVQTVWTVFLPAPLPYVTVADVNQLRNGIPSEQPVHPVAHMLAQVPTPGTEWWVEGGYLYAVQENPARPQLVADHIDRLTRFAAQIPWHQIRP